jgi:hypothetical protein
MSSEMDNRVGCRGFQGDENVYGLGIRLEIYLQWIDSALVYNFVPEDVSEADNISHCSRLAVFIALLYVTIARVSVEDGGALSPAAAYIIFSLCAGDSYSPLTKSKAIVGTASEPHDRKLGIALDGVTTGSIVVKVLLTSLIFMYGVWLVFNGLDHMRRGNCGTTVFFFAPVDLFGGVRVFLKVMFAIGGSFVGLLTLLALFALMKKIVTEGPGSFFSRFLTTADSRFKQGSPHAWNRSTPS